MTTEAIELSAFFEQPEIDAETYERVADAAHVSFAARERFETLTREYRARVEQRQGDVLRLGLALLALGKFADARSCFKEAPPGKLRHYYAAQAALGLGRCDEALEELRHAANRGWDPCACDLAQAAIHVQTGDLAAAEALVRKQEQPGRDRAEWYYARGLIAEAGGEREAAAEEYERALTLDAGHTPAMFRGARLCDVLGDDAAALALYERLAAHPRAYVNALLNAAVVYEDRGRYDEALGCVQRVLRLYPNHTRARLFHKDIESCRHMVIDETGEQRVDAHARLLDTPLTEFEFSVRARNCLKKMNIRTVGELIRLTEEELMAYKNFGETSLAEIKAMLTKRSLHLGQRPEELEEAAVEPAAAPRTPVPPGQEAVLSKPVGELELSVRARRCLQRLNVQTLGDLVQYSEADLLATRNFGVTSLNEVKVRLGDHGLQLTPKRAT
jgi:DNA-directed RNA polymerase subunit alpha